MSDDVPADPPSEPEKVVSETAAASLESGPQAPAAPGPPPPQSEAIVVASPKPNYPFLAIVSIASLVADLATKWWASVRISEEMVDRDVIPGHVAFIFARNRGGAWGLLQNENEMVRRPFFVLISVGAIVFIVSLYRRLTPRQWALKWGLPLVLGGALGNLVDRIRYGHVIDFIDVRAGWIGWLNGLFGHQSDHWPTFNIADIAICVGVGLMAVDMFQSRKPKTIVVTHAAPLAPPAAPAEPVVESHPEG